MIQIDNTIIVSDLYTCFFVCDLPFCKGACCVHGNTGAPLSKEEAIMLEKTLPDLVPFLRHEGIDTIKRIGTSVTDSEYDRVTPLINERECAYSVFEKGIARCGIEKAYLAGAIGLQKPISCHLYPARIRNHETYDSVNYVQWDMCKPAVIRGKKMNLPLYSFIKDALTRKYGKKWFEKLVMAIRKLENERNL